MNIYIAGNRLTTVIVWIWSKMAKNFLQQFERFQKKNWQESINVPLNTKIVDKLKAKTK